MITAITFQFAYNKKYLNKELVTSIYEDRSTEQLQEILLGDIIFLSKVHTLVSRLNSDLLTCRIPEIIEEIFNMKVTPTKKTKHTRTYFIGGITIHEQDQTM